MFFDAKYTILASAAVVGLGLSPVATAAGVEPCVDLHEGKFQCKEWAWFGECIKNPAFMHTQCKKSCGLCSSETASDSTESTASEDTCRNWHASCEDWAEKGNDQVDNLCKGNWNSMKNGKKITGAYVIEFCPKACNVCDVHLDDRDIDLGIGLPQSYPGMETDKELRNLLKSKVAETRAYIESIENDEIRNVCKMSHPHCARYSLSTDCDTHFDHPLIKYGCAAACHTCDKLVNDNGIIEARQMWGVALREFNEKQLVKKTIEVTA
mmetsp:Transcript_5111/g.14850  ORF Transcript_5111/g.14850 Transcript_5111/m.14850 type:complete len:267 (-) Transcript_5111:261-1061(-)|eukprot:CAMPEP_0172366242 /NCGR_PEP_ID=MMETSP1060-20121228/14330_1 /TAXON_ID=37318 /ORGANISM="Pseudo-nitzschia pungens, Strain cf. cingulata" /LENGTH=266 /DNA_ID=CAMNT_0013090005 /DNA_START=111 /DNA_END=911 /DNA_ORIENTATION=-